MSTNRDATRIVRSWLEEGVTALPDRVLDQVLDQLPATPQRRSAWLAWRFAPMNNALRIAVVAVVVVVIGIVGIQLLPDSGFGGQPSPTPTATPTPMPFPTGSGALDAGTYVAHPFVDDREPYHSIGMTFTLPGGWESIVEGLVIVGPSRQGSFDPPSELTILFGNRVDGLFSDPCNADYSTGATDVAVGTTVDDLANAFAAQTAYDSTTPTDVTLGGYSGKKMDLVMPTDIDFKACNEEGFFIWPGSIYAQGPGNVWHLWILDVEGTRIVIFIQDFPATPDESKAEAQAILDSLQITP